jgi:hypothetical protein
VPVVVHRRILTGQPFGVNLFTYDAR